MYLDIFSKILKILRYDYGLQKDTRSLNQSEYLELKDFSFFSSNRFYFKNKIYRVKKNQVPLKY